MPLIIITGYPCSGKTYRARQLASAFKERIAGITEASASCTPKFTIHHIPSYHSSTLQLSIHGHCPNRDSIYTSAALEKTARAAELSAIKRALSKDALVIADDLNYIKGFRYQLWCEAKAARTTCCTVHCAAKDDEVDKWNRVRLRQWAEMEGGDLPEDDDGPTTTNGHAENNATKTMLPQSHTALYGDRIPDMPSRSRSSSMDANDGEEIVPPPSTLKEESLRSFSFTDQLSVPMAEAFSETARIINLPSTALEERSATSNLDFPSPSSTPYSSTTLLSLIMRYEPPSPFSRWDTPLFTVPACDPMPPVSAIWDALFPPQSACTMQRSGVTKLTAEVKPHAATVLPQATDADALQILERITADVVTQIMTLAKEHPELTVEGGDIPVSFAGTVATLSIPPGTILSLPMLQRLRRRFTQIQRGGIAHGKGYVQGEQPAAEAFVRFLNGEMGS